MLPSFVDTRFGRRWKLKEIRSLDRSYHWNIKNMSDDNSLLRGLRAAYQEGYLDFKRNILLTGLSQTIVRQLRFH